MKWLIFFLALLSSSTLVAQTTPQGDPGGKNAALDAVDREMIEQLRLRDDQVGEYVAIIHLQREAFLTLEQTRWQYEANLYETTIDMLKPVLDDVQLAKFAALVGCLSVENRYSLSSRVE